MAPEAVSEGSRFKGCENFTVQVIRIAAHKTRYRMKRWQTPEGHSLVGKLPREVGESHFGPVLRAFILYQYHRRYHAAAPCRAAEGVGVDISAGQISAILAEGKEALLRVGLQYSDYVRVDATSARHRGKNGCCTHIGTELFAYLASSDSKSRINFLALPRAGCDEYTLNGETMAYLETQNLPRRPLDHLAGQTRKQMSGMKAWLDTLQALGVTTPRHVRIATEGALLGTVLEHGVNPNLAIVSDDAGQFNVLLHELCWIHAERTLQKLVGSSDEQRAALEKTRTRIWDFFEILKAYKEAPGETNKREIEARFDSYSPERPASSR